MKASSQTLSPTARETIFGSARLLAFLLLFAVAAAPAQYSRPILITKPVDESQVVVLAGNTRPEANAKYDRGRVADNFPMEHMLLLLKRSPDQEWKLEKLIEELHNPSSSNFHRWLTAAEMGEEFGVAEQDREAIKNWLESHGFKISVDYTNALVLDFSGTASQVEEAFHTAIHHLEVGGEQHFANMRDPEIPAALAPAIEGIVSLHNFRPHPLYQDRTNYTVSVSGKTEYLVVPGDLATIYNLNPLFSEGISGQSQTIVAIEDTDVYSPADWTSFRSVFGLSSYTDGSFTQIHPAPASGSNNCSDPGIIGSDREAILDAEYASAAAPSAAIVLASCTTTSTFGGLIALQNLLNQSNTPPALVSMSYGECEANSGAATNAAFNSTFQQAVAEGVSVFVGSGDNASAFCDRYDEGATFGIAVTGWGSSPYDVAVGGTDFGDTFAGSNSTYWSNANSSTYASALSYVPEIPWNDSCGSLLIARFEGFSQTYGSSGFCNSSLGEANFLNTFGGGGGPSGCATGTPSVAGVVSGTCAGWPKPSYQKVLGNPSDGVRDVPDLSLFAANGVWLHAYPYCFTGPGGAPCTEAPVNWPSAGGTSFAGPIMAGIQALVNQKTGARQGNPNFVYYQLAGTEYGAKGNPGCNSTLGNTVASSCIFHDVTRGDNDVGCIKPYDCYLPSGANGVLSTSDSAYQPAYAAAAGWDFATGIGTVNAYNLVSNWPTSYTLTANPGSLSVVQGAKTATTISIVPSNGFSGSVTLSVSGLPDGVTAAFSVNPASSDSTLTLTAAKTAVTGTVTVTITGTSGVLTETTQVQLTVSGEPTFALFANPSGVSVVQGQQATSTISITPSNGFSGSVTLSASGLPTGVTAGFSVNPATSTSTLTLAATSTATTGSYTITITGTSGNLTETTQISLTVKPAPSFALSASPSSVSVVQGNQTTSTITVTPANGFSSSVTLSAAGLPTGVTAGFSVNPAASSSLLTLSANSTAIIGTFTVTITGTSGNLTEATQLQLTVGRAPSFTLSSNPSSVSVIQGNQTSSTITVTPANGFSGSVTLSASGLPTGVTAGFSVNPATSSSLLTLTAGATATPGTSAVTVTGISGSLSETVQLQLTIGRAPSFTLSANPSSLSVIRGNQTTSTITVTPANGFSGSVTLSASALPSGVTASFSVNPATSSGLLTLTANSTATTGTFTVTITGTSGNLTDTTQISLTVKPAPSFALSASPSSVSLVQGNQTTSTITVTPANGFSGSVTLSASALPSGVTASFSVNPATSSSLLTLTANSTATTGTFTVTITGTSGNLTDTTQISLTVKPAPSFALSASPSSVSLVQGKQMTSTITIIPANGFSGSVTLSSSSLPTGVTAGFSVDPATSSSLLTLTADSTATTGTFTVTITGASGSLKAKTTLKLTVNGLGSFTLKAYPSPVTVSQGGKGSTTVTIVPTGGFDHAVTLSAYGLPSGVTASFSPNPATNTSTLTLTASPSAQQGLFTFTVAGTSGTLSAELGLGVSIAPR